MTKILVVDDSKTYMNFTVDVLTTSGFEVVTSDNAWISNLVIKENPDVVLMDVVLGSVNGVEAVKILKKRKFAENIKFILHSSEDKCYLEESVRSCGANGYIFKDGNKYSLLSGLNKHGIII